MKHSVTRYNTYYKCKRQFYITYTMGIRPAGKNNAFATGEGFHKALECMVKDLTMYGKLRDREYYIDMYQTTVMSSKNLADNVPEVVDKYIGAVSAQHGQPLPKAFSLNGKLLVETWLPGTIEGEEYTGKQDVFSDKFIIWDHKRPAKSTNNQTWRTSQAHDSNYSQWHG
jgi:hypothetical protein